MGDGQMKKYNEEEYINIKELIAIKLAILAYAPLYITLRHIRVISDNTTALAYVNKQGGNKCMTLNDIAIKIWDICRQRNIHLLISLVDIIL